MGFPQFSTAFEKIQQNLQFFEEDYFYHEDIKTLNKQVTSFDKAIQSVKKAVDKNKLPKTPGALEKLLPPDAKDVPVEPRPPQQKEPQRPSPPEQESHPEPPNGPNRADPGGQSSEPTVELISEKLLSEIVDKKQTFLRSMFRDNEELIRVQTSYLEYRRGFERVQKGTDTIFSQQIPPHMESAQNEAVSRIFVETDFFQRLQSDSEKQVLNLGNEDDLYQLRQSTKQAVNQVFPGFDWDQFTQDKLADRGDSVRNPFELTDSQFDDENFVKDMKLLQKKRNQARRQEPVEDPIPVNEVKSEIVESVGRDSQIESQYEHRPGSRIEDPEPPKVLDLKSECIGRWFNGRWRLHQSALRTSRDGQPAQDAQGETRNADFGRGRAPTANRVLCGVENEGLGSVPTVEDAQ